MITDAWLKENMGDDGIQQMHSSRKALVIAVSKGVLGTPDEVSLTGACGPCDKVWRIKAALRDLKAVAARGIDPLAAFAGQFQQAVVKDGCRHMPTDVAARIERQRWNMTGETPAMVREGEAKIEAAYDRLLGRSNIN